MGLTAEAVAQQFKVSREDQDEFAYHSHMKALKAQGKKQIVPITANVIKMKRKKN
jgi:acetyl-CoA acyltransferase